MRELLASFKINATTTEVYQALTNQLTLELWTGYPAVMNPSEGSEFELWDGDISGINLEFETNHKIVQEWYFGEQEAKSIVTMILKPRGRITIIGLIHTNIPDEAYDNIKKGWFEIYFRSLKEFYR